MDYIYMNIHFFFHNTMYVGIQGVVCESLMLFKFSVLHLHLHVGDYAVARSGQKVRLCEMANVELGSDIWVVYTLFL